MLPISISDMIRSIKRELEIFVGFTLEAKLVSSKYLTQVHFKIWNRTLENLASHLMTKYILCTSEKVMKPLQRKTFYVEMYRYFVAENSATEEATPVFVENGSATWFSVKISPQGLAHKIGFACSEITETWIRFWICISMWLIQRSTLRMIWQEIVYLSFHPWRRCTWLSVDFPFPIGQVRSQVWCRPYLAVYFGFFDLRTFSWSLKKVQVSRFYPFTLKVGSKCT